MATDATGTPTSLGIPKYNTAADAPSGKGFNAAMDQIDSILVARALPASPGTNHSVYWNGSAWVSAKLTANQLDPNAGVPAGVVAFTAGAAAPSGWVICDGAAISRSSFAVLFAEIGTQYGVGDGSSTFNVPNLKGRVPVGIDSAQTEFDVRGETGGEKTHALTPAETALRTHTHDGPGGFFYGTTGANWFNLTMSGGNVVTAFAQTGGMHEAETNGGAHNNLQPYLSLHGIIKT